MPFSIFKNQDKPMRNCVYHDYRHKASNKKVKFAFCCQNKKFINVNNHCSKACPHFEDERKYL